MGAIASAVIIGVIIVIKSVFSALKGQKVITAPWYKRMKSFIKRQPLGIIALYKHDADTNPTYVWSYMKGNKLRWKDYAVPPTEQRDGMDYAEILPGGMLRHGTPYFNTLDAHEASEGHGIRMLGTGGALATNVILIVGLIFLGAISVFIWYSTSQGTEALTAQIELMQAQLDEANSQLMNLTRVIFGK